MAVSLIQTANDYDSWASGAVQAYKIGHICYVTWVTIVSNVVSGHVYQIATLPEKFRPINTYRGAWIGIMSDNPCSRGRFVIDTDGLITWCGDTLSAGQEFSGSACYITKG